MSVSLDLDDAVTTVVSFLNDEFKSTAQTVETGFTRGGYSGTKPRIIPVEGVAGKPRKGRTNIQQMNAKAEILVYEVSDNEDEVTIDEKFANVEIRVSIDIFTVLGRIKLNELYNEIRRCIMKRKLTPGGNYNIVKRISKVNLTNRSTGIWRIVIDIMLIKVSDFIGHL